jgi:hypothetical protein
MGLGEGTAKKHAEQAAAEQAYRAIKTLGAGGLGGPVGDRDAVAGADA